MGGVEAADVEGGIGFRIAEALRFGEAIFERDFLGFHLRQDVVAGAVQNAVDARYFVAGEALAQRLDDRDAARDRRLELEGDARGLRPCRQVEAVVGKHRFVGGDHAFAGVERGAGRGESRAALPADQLDEAIDVRTLREGDGIVVPGNPP